MCVLGFITVYEARSNNFVVKYMAGSKIVQMCTDMFPDPLRTDLFYELFKYYYKFNNILAIYWRPSPFIPELYKLGSSCDYLQVYMFLNQLNHFN